MRLLLALLIALPAFGQIVTSTSRGAVVANDGRLALRGGWNVPGVETPTAIVAGRERVAVLDALHNEAVIADLATGKTERVQTAETPVAGAFIGRDLYVLARDAGVVQKFGPAASSPAFRPASPRRDGGAPAGETPALHVAGDFLRQSNGALYVYSRTAGTLAEIVNDRVTRRVQVAPFASAFEIGGRTGYLVFPREARIRTLDLASMNVTGSVTVGAVPVDLAFAGGGTAITARVLAVADPSAKRVWLTEETQSTMQAVTRGFLRGFLGLGLFGSRSSQFPTGVDRVLIRDRIWLAYDSSSGTLYQFTKSKSSVIAKGVAPQAFAITAEGVVYWKDGTLVAQRRER
jgi:hypothetical protein